MNDVDKNNVDYFVTVVLRGVLFNIEQLHFKSRTVDTRIPPLLMWSKIRIMVAKLFLGMGKKITKENIELFNTITREKIFTQLKEGIVDYKNGVAYPEVRHRYIEGMEIRKIPTWIMYRVEKITTTDKLEYSEQLTWIIYNLSQRIRQEFVNIAEEI